jgi:hypothetical protein
MRQSMCNGCEEKARTGTVLQFEKRAMIVPTKRTFSGQTREPSATLPLAQKADRPRLTDFVSSSEIRTPRCSPFKTWATTQDEFVWPFHRGD